MERTDRSENLECNTSAISLSVLPDILLAVVVGLVMAVVANTFVEGARGFLGIACRRLYPCKLVEPMQISTSF